MGNTAETERGSFGYWSSYWLITINKMPHKVIELLNRDLSKLSEKCKEVALKHRSRVISEVDTLLHTLVSET